MLQDKEMLINNKSNCGFTDKIREVIPISVKNLLKGDAE